MMRFRKGQDLLRAAQQVSFLPAWLFHRCYGVESQEVDGLDLVTKSNAFWTMGGRGMARMTCYIFLKPEDFKFLDMLAHNPLCPGRP